MKDIHSELKAVVAVATAVLSADPTALVIDTQGFNAVELLLAIGVGGITFTGTNKIEFVLTHSDDNSTFTNVTDVDMLGVSGISNGIIKSLTSAHAAAAVYRYGYKGNKRYVKLLPDFSGTHATGTPMSAIALLSEGHDNPQANQA